MTWKLDTRTDKRLVEPLPRNCDVLMTLYAGTTTTLNFTKTRTWKKELPPQQAQDGDFDLTSFTAPYGIVTHAKYTKVRRNFCLSIDVYRDQSISVELRRQITWTFEISPPSCEVARLRLYGNPSGELSTVRTNSRTIILERDRVRWALVGYIWNIAQCITS